MLSAISAGLHIQSGYSNVGLSRRKSLVETWWSISTLEALLSSMIGRPSWVRGDQCTAPLPSEILDRPSRHDFSQTPSLLYQEAQIRIATITQEALSKLYNENRNPRLWPQIHAVITSTTVELDRWAVDVQSRIPEAAHDKAMHKVQLIMLRKQYYRTKILITRPSLQRIERCSEIGSEDFSAFDQEVAEACIHAAQGVVSLLPENINLNVLYENGPWWTTTHNSKHYFYNFSSLSTTQRADEHGVMQALTILLTSVSLRHYFPALYDSSVRNTVKLIAWLQCMRQSNKTAKRAYEVVLDIVKGPGLFNPAVWEDIAHIFPDESLV
jgi:hypothetical protein